MAKVDHDAGAQFNCVQVGATAKNSAGRDADSRTEVSMHITIISLEQTEAESVVGERKVVVHTSADRQRRTPSVGLVLERRGDLAVWAAQSRSANQAVRKQGEVLHRQAGNYPRHAVVHTIRMIRIDELSTKVVIEVICAATDRTKIDGRVRNARGLNPSMGS